MTLPLFATDLTADQSELTLTENHLIKTIGTQEKINYFKYLLSFPKNKEVSSLLLSDFLIVKDTAELGHIVGTYT